MSRGEAVEAVNKQTDRRSLLPLSQIVMMTIMMVVMVKMMVMVVLMTMIEMMSEQTIRRMSQILMMIIQQATGWYI